MQINNLLSPGAVCIMWQGGVVSVSMKDIEEAEEAEEAKDFGYQLSSYLNARNGDQNIGEIIFSYCVEDESSFFKKNYLPSFKQGFSVACQENNYGKFSSKDEEGFLLNETSFRKIQPEWVESLQDVIKSYRNIFYGLNLSVYLRGSVAKGRAAFGISDLDTFAIVDVDDEKLQTVNFSKQIEHIQDKYKFINGVDMFVVSPNFVTSNSWMINIVKAHSLCIYGDDIIPNLPRVRPGKETIMHLLDFPNEICKANQKIHACLQNPYQIKHTGFHIMKLILRMGFEMVCHRENEYTRDLGIAYQTFIKYYPEMKLHMRETLKLALHPKNSMQYIVAVKSNFIIISEWMSKILVDHNNLIFGSQSFSEYLGQVSLM